MLIIQFLELFCRLEIARAWSEAEKLVVDKREYSINIEECAK